MRRTGLGPPLNARHVSAWGGMTCNGLKGWVEVHYDSERGSIATELIEESVVNLKDLFWFYAQIQFFKQ